MVDDDVSVLDMLSEYLAGCGYEVQTAIGGEQALIAVRNRRPDLVLLDVNMPDLDGLEVLKRLRQIDSRIPVVMVTTNEDAEIMRETLRRGAVNYVTKPVDLDHLGQVVAAALMTPGRQRHPDS